MIRGHPLHLKTPLTHRLYNSHKRNISESPIHKIKNIKLPIRPCLSNLVTCIRVHAKLLHLDSPNNGAILAKGIADHVLVERFASPLSNQI